jgi:hypothetical protein
MATSAIDPNNVGIAQEFTFHVPPRRYKPPEAGAPRWYQDARLATCLGEAR